MKTPYEKCYEKLWKPYKIAMKILWNSPVKNPYEMKIQ